MILIGDVREQLRQLEPESVHCVVTSPPYWTLVDYDAPGQLGLEPTMAEHLDALSDVFAEVRRVLRPDGTLWINYGDAFNTCNGGAGPGSGRAWTRKRGRSPKLVTGHGLKTKDVPRKNLMGLPWRLAFRLQDDGWNLRGDVIWRKPTPVERKNLDRPVKSHEYVFFLTPRPRSYFAGRVESVWEITPEPFANHPAPFPRELARRCVLAGCPEGGTVLDPFFGAGTVGVVAEELGREWIGIELNPAYAEIAKRRLGDSKQELLFPGGRPK